MWDLRLKKGQPEKMSLSKVKTRHMWLTNLKKWQLMTKRIPGFKRMWSDLTLTFCSTKKWSEVRQTSGRTSLKNSTEPQERTILSVSLSETLNRKHLDPNLPSVIQSSWTLSLLLKIILRKKASRVAIVLKTKAVIRVSRDRAIILLFSVKKRVSQISSQNRVWQVKSVPRLEAIQWKLLVEWHPPSGRKKFQKKANVS